MKIIIIYAILLVFIFLLFLFTRNYKKSFSCKLKMKEYPLKIFYGTAFYIIDHTSAFKKKFFSNSVQNGRLRKNLEQLYIGQNIDNIEYLFHAKRITYALLIFSLALLMGLCYSLYQIQGQKNITALPRADEDTSYSLEVTMDNNETQIIDITVNAKEFNYSEVLELFEKYREGIVSSMLGENPSISEVSSPLNFISSYGDENLKISWEVEDETLIDYSGNICQENVGEYGTYTNVSAALTLGEYTTTLTIPLFLVP